MSDLRSTTVIAARDLRPGDYVANLGEVSSAYPSSGMHGYVRLIITNNTGIMNSPKIGVDVRREALVVVHPAEDIREAPVVDFPCCDRGEHNVASPAVPEAVASGLVGLILAADSFQDLQYRIRLYRSAAYGKRRAGCSD